MQLAPVVVFTFNRLNHTIKTIEALKSNNLAKETDLFIFSDGGRNDIENEKVSEVRQYLKTVTGFKSIKLMEAKKNKGLATSVINGVTEIINVYGNVIVLEDDLVTSKYFLEYMNEALELYKNRKDIWSITGYSPNIQIPKEYEDDVYLIRRGASWGWATWDDRWKLNDWQVKDYKEFKKNRALRRRFNQAGSDMSPMLNDQMEGRINSWAIRWGYNQFKNNMWTVYPVKPLVKNMGNDLSGTHSAITDKYMVEIVDERVKPNLDVKIDKDICDSFKAFYDLDILGYIAIVIKKLGLYKPARKLRNKIMVAVRG